MVKFPQNTALPDEDQTDIAVSGAGPGVFLLSLRDVVQVVSSGQQRPVDMWDTAITFPDCWSWSRPDDEQPAAGGDGETFKIL